MVLILTMHISNAVMIVSAAETGNDAVQRHAEEVDAMILQIGALRAEQLMKEEITSDSVRNSSLSEI